LTAVSATATSGDASLAIDGYNDSIKGVNNTMHSNKGESLWTSTGALPQSITLNLGKSYDNIDMLEYLPQRHTGTTAGNITSYKVFVSKDNVTFTQVASGTWPADATYHGLLCPQRVQFPAQSAQYVRLEADAVSGGGTSAIAGEIAVGSSGATETAGTGGSGGTGGNSGTGGTGGGAVQGAVGVLAVPLAAGVQWRIRWKCDHWRWWAWWERDNFVPDRRREWWHGRSRCKRDQHHWTGRILRPVARRAAALSRQTRTPALPRRIE